MSIFTSREVDPFDTRTGSDRSLLSTTLDRLRGETSDQANSMFGLLKDTITTQLNRRTSSQKLNDHPSSRSRAKEKGKGKIRERVSTLDLLSNVRTAAPTAPPPPYSVNLPPKRPLKRNNLIAARPEDRNLDHGLISPRSSTLGRPSKPREIESSTLLTSDNLKRVDYDDGENTRYSFPPKPIIPPARQSGQRQAIGVLSIENLNRHEREIEDKIIRDSIQRNSSGRTTEYRMRNGLHLKELTYDNLKHMEETSDLHTTRSSPRKHPAMLNDNYPRGPRHLSDPLPRTVFQNADGKYYRIQGLHEDNVAILERKAQRLGGSIWQAYERGKRLEIELELEMELEREKEEYRQKRASKEKQKRSKLVLDTETIPYHEAGPSRDFLPGGRHHDRSYAEDLDTQPSVSKARAGATGSLSFDSDLVIALRLQSTWDREDEDLREQREFALAVQSGSVDLTSANLKRLEAVHRARPSLLESRSREDARHSTQRLSLGRSKVQYADDIVQAEGMKVAAVEPRRSSQMVLPCVSCMELKTKALTATLACKHVYCGDCIAEAFRTAKTSRTEFKCCGVSVPILHALPFLPKTIVKAYTALLLEKSTPNPKYCHDCSNFIPPKFIKGSSCLCPVCRKRSCRICGDKAHPGVCADDEEGKKVLALARKKGWKTCTCGWILERNQGCLHMTCRCGAEWCYSCMEKWGDCKSTCRRRE
ncbi:RING/U-box [Glarea lozoyensis ATCC 20868]|uniref:RBR-type E3 ubiquitin transferase n=1 Tax=Glarea lozoyensis (strain ATCC 20868 / MF5171) TaxID=1116229 RepID=S3DGS9_GLAL2|nr:RING/U-box [Glarea lozoyensis ATCC 20868]EPE31241.1 RING/U-box [Glarea lozoyensis ATCC 20868]